MANQLSPIKHENDDRMSELPEPILHHILCFLSTKQAAQTSVLSKPWRYLWTCLPDLDISQGQIRGKGISFDQIMLKIFLSRRAWCLRKLRILLTSDFDPISIRFYLCAAVERNVEELDFHNCKLFELPTGLFCSKTLVVLKLCFKVMVDIGSSVHLPSLKVLHLLWVMYKDEDTFRCLFRGCPVLDYILVGFVPHEGFHYEISSLSVRHIYLRQCSNGTYSPPLKITVNAPALEHFAIELYPCVLVLNNVSSSAHAKFNIFMLQLRLRDDYLSTIKVIFGALCNVQFLELGFNSPEVRLDHNIPMDIFPRFDNLVQLKLLRYRFPLPVLLNILRNCSRLEHLTFASEIRYCPCKTKPQCWMSPQHVPNCLTFHLTTIKFEGFKGSKPEMEFAKYVLKNSKVLKNMTVISSRQINFRRKFKAFLKISMFEKQARKCHLTFQQQVW